MMHETEFQPDWVSPPGETIVEFLKLKGFSVTEFAQRLGKPINEVDALIAGHCVIDERIAKKLSEILGSSSHFWLARESDYRRSLADIAKNQGPDWAESFPIRDMVSFGWLSAIPAKADRLHVCLSFFDVPNISTWEHRYGNVLQTSAYRASSAFKTCPNAVAAWIRQGEREADIAQCGFWNADKLHSLLPELRALTCEKNPAVFLPKLKKHLASCGVASAIVRAPSGCRASGATRFIDSSKALVLLSFRHLSDDHFWFTFFHEIGHLLLHDKSAIFIEGAGDKTQEENEANAFAAELLIPSKLRGEMLELPAERYEIVRFARAIGISPGLVVGQLQFAKKLRHDQLNILKRRFSWD